MCLYFPCWQKKQRNMILQIRSSENSLPALQQDPPMSRTVFWSRGHLLGFSGCPRMCAEELASALQQACPCFPFLNSSSLFLSALDCAEQWGTKVRGERIGEKVVRIIALRPWWSVCWNQFCPRAFHQSVWSLETSFHQGLTLWPLVGPESQWGRFGIHVCLQMTTKMSAQSED